MRKITGVPVLWAELAVGEIHAPGSDDAGRGVLVRRDEVGSEGFALSFMIVPPFLCPTGPGAPGTAR